MVPMAIGITMCVVLLISCTAQNTTNRIYHAYELRMDGKADSAKILLDQILEEDSTNALAWFEVTRTIQHLGNADMRKMVENQEQALYSINQAIKFDPGNWYYHSYKGSIEALNMYISLNMGKENVGEEIQLMENTYLKALELNPEAYEIKLQLVEIFYGLPAEMGGNPQKAKLYADELQNSDGVFGALGNEILMPEDADYIAYWENILEKYPENEQVKESLGTTHLYSGNVEEAGKYYGEVIDGNPKKVRLYLNLGRYYMMQIMQGAATADSMAPLIEKEFNKYLNSSPEPNNSMKAWVKSHLSKIKYHAGQEETGKLLQEEANTLDPYHSRATGLPDQALFCKPGEAVSNIGYFFRPF